MKLFQLLEDMERQNGTWIVSWSSDGDSFRVHNNSVFVQKVMPRYFRQTKYKSFQRQLHLYGYYRVTAGKYRGSYCHPMFLKNRRELCQQILPMKKTRQSESGTAQEVGEKSLVKETDSPKGFGSQSKSDSKLAATPRMANPLHLFPPSSHGCASAGGTIQAATNPSFFGPHVAIPPNAFSQGWSLQGHREQAAKTSVRAPVASSMLDQQIPQRLPTDLHNVDEAFPINLLLSRMAAMHGVGLQVLEGPGHETAIQPLFQARSSMMPNAAEPSTAKPNAALDTHGQVPIFPHQQQFHQVVNSSSALPIPVASGHLPVAVTVTSGGHRIGMGGENSTLLPYIEKVGPSVHKVPSIQSIAYDKGLPLLGGEEGNDVVLVSESSEAQNSGTGEVVSQGGTMATTTIAAPDLPEDFDYSILEPRPFKG